MKAIKHTKGNVDLISSNLIGEEALRYMGELVHLIGDADTPAWLNSIELTTAEIINKEGESVFGESVAGNIRISLPRIVTEMSKCIIEGKEELSPEALSFMILSEITAHEIIHTCYPDLDEEVVEKTARQVVWNMAEKFHINLPIGGYISEKIGELLMTLPKESKYRTMVENGIDMLSEDGTPHTIREYIKEIVERKAGQEIAWPEPSTLGNHIITNTPKKEETSMEETTTANDVTEEKAKMEETTNKEETSMEDTATKLDVTKVEEEPEIIFFEDKAEYTYDEYREAGWKHSHMVGVGIAKWKKAPAPPTFEAEKPTARKAPAPPVHKASRSIPKPPMPETQQNAVPAPYGLRRDPKTGAIDYGFSNSELRQPTLRRRSSGSPIQTRPSVQQREHGGLTVLNRKPYNPHDLDEDTVREILLGLAEAVFDHMFRDEMQYLGDTLGSPVIPFGNPEAIYQPMSLRVLERVNPNPWLVVKEFQTPGTDNAGFTDCLREDGSFGLRGFVARQGVSAGMPVVKVRVNEGDGGITELMFFCARAIPTQSPTSMTNVEHIINGARMMWVRASTAENPRGALVLKVTDYMDGRDLELDPLKTTIGLTGGLGVQDSRDQRMVEQARTYRNVGLQNRAMSARSSQVILRDNSIPYEDYIREGWTNELLVQEGLADWRKTTVPSPEVATRRTPKPPVSRQQTANEEYPSLDQFEG